MSGHDIDHFFAQLSEFRYLSNGERLDDHRID
jgi:hypothetical protein